MTVVHPERMYTQRLESEEGFLSKYHTTHALVVLPHQHHNHNHNNTITHNKRPYRIEQPQQEDNPPGMDF